MGFRYLALSFVLVVMSACGPEKAKVDAQLVFGSESSPVEELFSTYGGLITARAIMSYEGLQPGGVSGYQVEPPVAAPTFLDTTDGQEIQRTTFWHKAGGEGYNPFASGTFTVPNVPLNQKKLRVGIEFLLPFIDNTTGETQYFVIAYACFVGPDTEITEDQLKSAFQNGLEVFAGRTCGKCPIAETQYQGQDQPGFTVDAFSGDDPEAPQLCP